MLEDRIYKDYVDALKSKDRSRADFLSFIRAELKNASKEAKKDKLEDEQALKVLQKQKKRLEDTRESIANSGREDLIQRTAEELRILEGYLPQPLSEEELVRVIEEVISETGASSVKDMGKVMKESLSRIGARAESKKVSEVVKAKLSSP